MHRVYISCIICSKEWSNLSYMLVHTRQTNSITLCQKYKANKKLITKSEERKAERMTDIEARRGSQMGSQSKYTKLKYIEMEVTYSSQNIVTLAIQKEYQ